MTTATGKDAVEAILEHHGVKGMKWGVRRASKNKGGPGGPPRNPAKIKPGEKGYDRAAAKVQKEKQNGLSTSAAKQKVAKKLAKEDAKAEKKASGKIPAGGGKKLGSKKAMTDAQLKEVVARMQLEKQYKQLQAELNPRTESLGSKFAKASSDVAFSIAKQQATNFGNKQVESYLNNAIGKKKVDKSKGLSVSEMRQQIIERETRRKFNAL